MRIVSGRFKGRVLNPPSNLGVRPTTDRAREALFNILANRMELRGMRVLDLFAGSGAVALECVSRGAASVLATDRNVAVIRFVQQLAKDWGAEGLSLQKANALQAVLTIQGPFDLIFMDPPYAMPNKANLVTNSLKLLSDEGWAVLEHPASESYSDLAGFIDGRVYGQSAFSFFQRPQALPHA